MAKIIQYHASFIGTDAIGNSIRLLHKGLLDAGVDSYVSCADKQLGSAMPGTLPASSIINASLGQSLSENDILLLHYSFYDDVIERLARMPLRKICVYHNVTPGEFFDEVGLTGLANACFAARDQLSALAPFFDAAVGDSDFNARELSSFGYRNVSTIPVLMDIPGFLDGEIDLDLVQRLKSDVAVNLLFVGRLVPNKRIERIISAVAHFKSAFPLSINLHIAGKIWDNNYFSSLIDYASQVGASDSIRFHFNVDAQYLRTLYAIADTFICMSDHEGFMVPIVEAFAAGCPVIGLNRTAVGETMGSGGMLLTEPDPALVAGLVYALKTDWHLKQRVLAAQGRRLVSFYPGRTTRLWLDKISRLSPNFRASLDPV